MQSTKKGQYFSRYIFALISCLCCKRAVEMTMPTEHADTTSTDNYKLVSTKLLKKEKNGRWTKTGNRMLPSVKHLLFNKDPAVRSVRLTAPSSGCICLSPRWCCSNRWRTWWQSAARWHCGLLLAGHSCWALSGTGHSTQSLWFWGLAGSPECGAWAACWEFWLDSASLLGRRVRDSGAAGRPARPSLSPPSSSGYWCHAGS